jgi:L-malate glycosyltransferase
MAKETIKGNIVFIPDNDERYAQCQRMVLHVILPQPEGSLGGSDTHVLSLTAEQKKNSRFVPIVLFRRNNSYRHMLEEMGVAYIDGTQAKNLPSLARSLKDIPLRLPISLIHSHQYSANYLTYWIKKLNKKNWGKTNIIMTCHGWIENNFQDRISTFWDFFTYRIAKGLIAVCSKDEQRLHKKTKGKLITCIKNGVDIPADVDRRGEILAMKEKYCIPQDKVILAIIGRLSPEKRMDVFIRFAKELLEIRRDVHFLIVGKGNEEYKICDLIAEFGIEKNVTLTGFVQEIATIYAMIDILMLTSDTEGTPRVVLECMANRKSVIATNVGGLKEIIDNGINGVLLERGAYASMANIANRLLNDRAALTKQRNEAYAKIVELFSIQKMQELIEKFYFDVLQLEGNS